MKKLITLLLIVSVNAHADLDCSQASLHQKDQAKCLVMELVSNGTNSEIKEQVEAYENDGLQKSGELNAFFLGGDKVSGGSNWVYLVGVDYYNSDKFRSLAVVVKTYPDKQAEVVEVFSRSRINNLVK